MNRLTPLVPAAVALTFDPTINIGQIVGMIFIAGFLWSAKQLYGTLKRFVECVEDTADIVDDHSDILYPMSGRREEWPYVGERRRLRRKRDIERERA